MFILMFLKNINISIEVFDIFDIFQALFKGLGSFFLKCYSIGEEPLSNWRRTLGIIKPIEPHVNYAFSLSI